MTLDSKSRHLLKQRAHKLNPVVITGNAGLTDAVLAEIDRALDDHELIKVRLNVADRLERSECANQICEGLDALKIQVIGHIVTIYRKKREQ